MNLQLYILARSSKEIPNQIDSRTDDQAEKATHRHHEYKTSHCESKILADISVLLIRIDDIDNCRDDKDESGQIETTDRNTSPKVQPVFGFMFVF